MNCLIHYINFITSTSAVDGAERPYPDGSLGPEARAEMRAQERRYLARMDRRPPADFSGPAERLLSSREGDAPR